ncbi:hypothetical protein ACMD2_08566 [Ananas comosus]|uniref:Uncharacterized protein n=1 Tax=Ananas comosus TaxID=4615 RepID=A0A199USU1_ANACO|nr:hypothetical protein ACMD2_08566 [Ananas comosus]
MAIREHADLLQEIPFDGWLVVEGVILDSTPASEIKELVGVDGVAGAYGVGLVATPGLAGLAVAAGDSARAPAAAAVVVFEPHRHPEARGRGFRK